MRKFSAASLLAVFLCAMSTQASAATIFTEDFDDGSGFSTSTPFFSDAFSDFFGLTGGTDDFGAGSTPSGLKAYTGFTGSYLTGMDLDGEGASLPITVEWASIDISGATDLVFTGEFAEFFDSPGDIDPSDVLRVDADIDGNGYNTILEFTPGDFSSTVNGVFKLGAVALGDAAQSFSTPIPGTGSQLSLRLVVSVDSGDEDFAVDNFSVTGNVVPEPTSALLAMLGLTAFGCRVRRS